MTANKALLQIFVNPLAFTEADPPGALESAPAPTLEQVLRFLCGPEVPSDVTSILSRYRQIDVDEPQLSVVPAAPAILTKLVWPLHHAKASYLIGNYLGTIALCGLVSEMVAMLTFDTAKFSISGHALDENGEADLFGSRFERLGQERRCRVLRAYGLITADEYAQFDKVRQIRRKYLHLWSQGHDNLANDAVECFLAVVGLVVSGLGISIESGAVNMKQSILKYMQEHGLLSPAQQQD